MMWVLVTVIFRYYTYSQAVKFYSLIVVYEFAISEL